MSTEISPKDILNLAIVKKLKGYIDDKMAEFNDILANLHGDDGYTPIKGVDYFDGEPGKDFVPTEADLKRIALMVEVPVVEKVIERTEVIRELPMVTEVTETVDETAIVERIENDLPKLGEKFRDGLELLQGDERLSKESIKGIDEIEKDIDNLKKKPVGNEFGGGARALYALADVDVSGVQVGDTLIWGGTHWTAGPQSGGITLYSESLKSQTVDGVNVTFTTLHPITNVLNFSINNAYIHGAEYTVSGSTITFLVAPAADLSGKEFDIIYS